MKLQTLLEGSQPIGIIIERERETNDFEDIHFVYYNNMKSLTGYDANLAKYFVNDLREHDLWDHIEKFLAEKLKHQHAKGWGDDEHFVNTVYGPVTTDQLSDLIEELREEFDIRDEEQF